MEEEKAAAYYEELTRKGEGAARFKQGLGFSENAPPPSARGSALPSSSSSFLSTFVKASSSSTSAELEKQTRIDSIRSNLSKKKTSPLRRRSEEDEEEMHRSRVSRREERHSSSSRRRSRSRERRRSRSRSDRERERGRDRERRRRRSESDSSDGERRRRGRGRSRSSSPSRDRRLERRLENRRGVDDGVRWRASKTERNGGIDYPRQIEGFDKMSPAERIKAKMKFQLAETAKKDEMKGMGSGWERFEFDKDAPLDNDDEIEVAEDDGSLVKHIGQTFRFSAVKAKREEQIEAAHDLAMFGAPVSVPASTTYREAEAEAEAEADDDDEAAAQVEIKDNSGTDLATSLLSEKVLAKQQGSWRDRARAHRI